MAGADLKTIEAILKDVFLPPVVQQFYDETLLLDKLESRDQEIAFGKTAIVPLHVGRSGGLGARDEAERLPDPGNQGYARAQYDIKYLYGAFGVTGQAEFKTRSETGAFLQVLRAEIDGMRADLQKDLTRQIYGDGSATVCGVASSSGNVITLDADGAEAISKGFLYEGMVVDIGSLAAPSGSVAAQTIIAVNQSTPSITISGPTPTVAGSDLVFRSGNRSPGNGSNEITGLQQIVSTSTGTVVGGIDPTSATYWDNLRRDAGGSLDLDDMMIAYNTVRRAGGVPSDLLILTSLGVQRAYWHLFDTNIRFNEPQVLKGGFTKLEFQGSDLIADPSAPWGKMFFLDLSKLKVYSTGDWKFLDKDGSMLKWVPGYDMWQGVLARYMNIGTTSRRTQMVLYNITDTTGL